MSPKYPGEDLDAHLGKEGDVARKLAEVFEGTGIELDFWEHEPKRTNVAAIKRGIGGGKSLIYNGHTDVVPPGDPSKWTETDPYSGRYDGERVWGRGATDMKAGLVAQAYAAKILDELGVKLKGDLIVEAVVGEETMDHEAGTGSAISRGYVADGAVVTEPSSPEPLSVAPHSAGLLWFELEIKGKRTHASMRGQSIHASGGGPEVGVNAIDKAFIIYEALMRLEREWAFTKTHPDYVPGHFSILPGAIKGGPIFGEMVPFQLSEITVIDYLIWYPPQDDPAEVRKEIEEFIHHVASTDAWLRENPPIITWKQNWPANNPGEASDELVDAVVRAHRLGSVGTPFESMAEKLGFLAVCDATFLTEKGIPAVSYGPGDIGVAHADNEFASVDEVVMAAKTLALLAIDWCGDATDE
ncbi:ArgE/DapE family deacylase [Leucobacter sp. gxy201]